MARYRFARWEDELGNVWTTPSISLLIDRDMTLTAHYEEVVYPKAGLDSIRLTDQATGITYNVYPEKEVSYCTPGAGNLKLVIGYGNVGEVTGTIFYRVEDVDTGEIISAGRDVLDPGVHWETTIITDMPDRDRKVAVYVGHEEDGTDVQDVMYAWTVFKVVVEYTLTITSTVGGTTDPAPGSHTYPEGTVVSVTALPDAGYVLDHWELDGVDVGAPNPISVTMDADHALHAVFAVAPVPTATIQGKVTSAETGEPIEGVSITADGYSTTTGSEGVYSLSVALGVYTVTARKTGYLTEEVDVDASVEGTYVIDFALTRVVPAAVCPAAVIATCVYGPSLQLNVLRRFRDEFMARTSSGRWLSRAYYRVGKYIAEWLVDKDFVKRLLRGYLDFAIKVLKIEALR